MQENQTNEFLPLQVDSQIKTYLSETAKWGKFLAILGFIMCGLMILAAFAMTSISGGGYPGYTGMPMGIMVVICTFIAIFYFFPCLFLYRFSTKAQAAVRGDSQEDLQLSFKNLKNLFKFTGILTIIVLAIYGLILIGVMIGLGASF
jgi:hypothetical protein